MTRILMLRPDRHTVEGPVFSVIPQGGVQAFIPLPGVVAAFQRPGEQRIEGPVLAGAHTVASICRVWADGPVAVVPLPNHTLVRHGIGLPQLSGGLVPVAPLLASKLMTLDAVADGPNDTAAPGRSGLSLRQLQRRARAATGLTMVTADRLKRLTAARRDVLNSSKPLVEIALDHGFADQSYFTSMYRLWSGVTPGTDRARGSGDVVFLQDGPNWASLPDRLTEVGEVSCLWSKNI